MARGKWWMPGEIFRPRTGRWRRFRSFPGIFSRIFSGSPMTSVTSCSGSSVNASAPASRPVRHAAQRRDGVRHATFVPVSLPDLTRANPCGHWVCATSTNRARARAPPSVVAGDRAWSTSPMMGRARGGSDWMRVDDVASLAKSADGCICNERNACIRRVHPLRFTYHSDSEEEKQ